MKKLKRAPKFKTEAEERKFWQTADSFDYINWNKFEKWAFPNLKLTSTSITIRIPDSLLYRVKMRAHQKDIPYQTLMKQFIYQGLGE